MGNVLIQEFKHMYIYIPVLPLSVSCNFRKLPCPVSVSMLVLPRPSILGYGKGLFLYFFALILHVPLSSFPMSPNLHSIYSILDLLILNPFGSNGSL